MEILIPTQDVLHKQWCLFDQSNVTDFGDVVRKIPGNTLSFPFGFDTEENDRSVRSTRSLANIVSLSKRKNKK